MQNPCTRICTIGLLISAVSLVAQLPPSITEHPLPNAGSYSYDIATGPDGALRFTEHSASKVGVISGSKIGRITAAGGPLGLAVASSVLTFTGLAEYSAATANTAVIGFNGILPTGTSFKSYNPLVISGVSFATSIPGTFVNVTAADYYSPNYAGTILVDAGPTSATETLNITLPAPTFALALDYGQLGGSGTIILSNGFTYHPPYVPAVGNTAFVGFVSTTPITGLSYVVSGGSWVVEDLAISTIAQAQLSITEYAVPTPSSQPIGITAGPDGALWFTEVYASKIGRVTTAGEFTEFTIFSLYTPWGIAVGPDGALWFTELNIAKIGRISTAGAITEFSRGLAPFSGPSGITAGPDGALWFAEQNANKIGRITTAGVISEYPVPTPSSLPGGITVGPDGALWFTEYAGNKIGRITTAGVFTEFTIPTANSGPSGITAGPDGALWFTGTNANKIGRITTAGVFTEFTIPTSSSGPNLITAGPDGALWFTEYYGNNIGRITTAGVISEYPVPTAPSWPYGITAGPDGALWFAESNTSKIGRLGSPPVCNYALSSGGQGFSAAGGSGTITITTPAGCPWTVSGLPAWVTLTSPSSGTGSGTVTFQVLPTVGGDLSGSFTVAGQTFTVEQVGSVPGLAPAGSLAQVNSEGGWSFELDVVNLGTRAAATRVSFTDPNGNPLLMPLTFPQLPAAAGPELAATLDRTINAHARLVIESSGPANAPALLGSGQLFAHGPVSGFGIFSYPAFQWNAVVPLETRNATTYYLPFDNTGVLATGVALTNISNIAGADTSVQVTILNDTGTQIGTDTITLTAQQYEQFLLNKRYPQTANMRGTIQFQTSASGQISALGVRANGSALTTLPLLSDVDTPGGSISDVTYNGGFTSTFYLVNTGSSSSTFTLSFFDQNGNPLTVPLSFPQSTTTVSTAALTRTLAAGQMLELTTQAQDNAANISGSAQLTTTGSVSGFEIFRWNTYGQEASVPLETRTPQGFALVFDNTGGLNTGVALANAGASAASITALIYDDQGNLLQRPTINLPGRAQEVFMLPTNYPITAGRRGMVEFVVPLTGPISMIGIRTSGTTLTTVPILAN